MSDKIDKASRWDERFSAEEYVFGTEPNAFLKREAGRIAAGGRVLAIADGEGRNGVFLAQQGYNVVATDISTAGLAKSRKLAAARGVSLSWEQVDFASYNWPEAAFDAVVAIFVQFAGPALRQQMFSGFTRALKPGGILLLEGYRPKQLDYATGGPRVIENLYTEELLRDGFPGLEILALDSYDAEIEEGPGHAGMSALIDLVARKPI